MTATDRKRNERHRRYGRLTEGEIVPHGRMSTYNNWGCRCGPCTNAYMIWKSLYDANRKPSRKRLPSYLTAIADISGPELARLIQEQYDDDKQQRVGFAKRIAVNS